MFAKILAHVSFRAFGFCPWYPWGFFRPSFKSGLLSAKAEITLEFKRPLRQRLNTVRNSQSRALPFSLRTTSNKYKIMAFPSSPLTDFDMLVNVVLHSLPLILANVFSAKMATRNWVVMTSLQDICQQV